MLLTRLFVMSFFVSVVTQNGALLAQETGGADDEPGAASAQPEEQPDEAVAGGDDEADQEEDGDEEKPLLTSGLVSGLKFRSIGPALLSGRVSDFAVDPRNQARYFVAVASGGVWYTDSGGTTYKPVFDSQGSYSIGCVTMDPSNPNMIWVGTGENNSQRSVSFGDGVYRSRDGGGSWKNVGLKESEHIGMIRVDPRDSDVVYVAAQGPLWRSGGDRGLYKTTDGGETWERILHVSDDTGINEIHMDPRDPDVLYASAYQRRRHVWTLIDGGPESGLYKSTDAGANWRKINSGLPGGDKGRIGLAISPVDPDVLYAIVETADGGGVYRSVNRGESWERRSGYISTSPQYYNELVCDPMDVDTVYSLDTLLHRSEDGGATFSALPQGRRHVDHHALWINPSNPRYMLVGCDGGVYESWDRGQTWRFMPNLPVTQYYRVAVDTSEPFYFVYGGTQDNNTYGGPSRTTSSEGILNEDWFIILGGDGFEPAIDPTDPNIVYGQLQHGVLVRYDRRTGESVGIQPQERPGEDGYRWNWDSPLLISPHDPHRLYFAANILFRSDDRGDSWRAVSPDLTKQIDRNELEVMGRRQPVNAVAKHDSTSHYGNIVALSESPLVEGLIYVGTDDGLVQVTEDGGENWRKIESLPDIPEFSYVSCVYASQHDADTVYATFDNHKMGDFKAYVLKSVDRGVSWAPIAGDLPDRHVSYCIRQDHEKPELLFLGTEFGVFFSPDEGGKWLKLSGGLPTIAVRDLEIQEREVDLVLATFGRGFYVLDDYSPLRMLSEERLQEEAFFFPIDDALRYEQREKGRDSQGWSFYSASNPAFGATVTYYIKDKLFESLKDKRIEAEKEAKKKDETPPYPSLDVLRAEQDERRPRFMLTIRDDAGEIVQSIDAASGKGIHRSTWNLRYPPMSVGGRGWGGGGPLALPGTYTVTLEKELSGEVTPITGPEPFDVAPLYAHGLTAQERVEALEFYRKAGRLNRAVQSAQRTLGDADERISAMRTAIMGTPTVDQSLLAEVNALEDTAKAIRLALNGDPLLGEHDYPSPPSISSRASGASRGISGVTFGPTGTQRELYEQAAGAFGPVLQELRKLAGEAIPALGEKLDEAGVPWTPGRLPIWEPE